jgi:cytoskeletal protein RodZ
MTSKSPKHFTSETLQNHPKTLQKYLKIPQNTLKAPQNHPKTPQNTSKHLKTPQNQPKTQKLKTKQNLLIPLLCVLSICLVIGLHGRHLTCLAEK